MEAEPISHRKVLILTRDPMAAALVGMLLELDAFDPAFAAPGESPEEAVKRVRPLAVLMLEAQLEAARSDLFYARAAKRAVHIVLFGPTRQAPTVEALARARGVPWFTLPADRETVGRTLRALVADGNRPRSHTDRRRSPTTHHSEDGTLVYEDRDGQRWLVYDRRSGERRGAGRPEPDESAAGYRAFVSEAGEEWRYPHPTESVPDASASALERQLALAVRVENAGA